MKHEDDDLEQLDRYLDQRAAAGNRGIGPNGSAPRLSQIVATLRSMDAADRLPDPRPEFITQLEDQMELTSSRSSLPLGRLLHFNPPYDHPATLLPAVPGQRRLASGFARWSATIALLLAVALFASISFRGGGGGGRPATSLPALSSNTSNGITPLAYNPVDIAECATTARQAGTALALAGQAPSRAPILPVFGYVYDFDSATPGPRLSDPSRMVDPDEILAGLPPAGAAALAGVAGTLQEASACRFYYDPSPGFPSTSEANEGLDGRYFALYSDDYLRKEARVQEGSSGAVAAVGIAWIPIGPAPWGVDDARTLPDGRVVASVSASSDGLYDTSMVMVFSQAGDRWLIDEIAPVTYEPPAAIDYAQYLDVALRNPGGSATISTPAVDAFFSERPITVTLANLGDVAQVFVIDALGISVTVEAGHSVSFALTAPSGAYVMESYVGDPTNPDRSLRRLEAILRIVDIGTPVSMG